MQKIDYHKELNPAQLKAVESIEGAHLVIAGAGSGKTRVLTYRTAYLVEQGVRPQEILLLTFTRKAAEEMLRRASLILDERCSRVSGGTFHSFANLILRRYASALGFSSNFTILDASDAQDVVNLARGRLGFNKSEKRFPRKDTILDIISKGVNKSQTIERVLYSEYPQFCEWGPQIQRIKQEYASHKQAHSLMDYDDLLVFLKKLLTENSAVLSCLSRSYRYIMVDEYQDTNKLQAEIIYLLCRESKNIMVVGDDSQSIYSFRGANFRNIIDFPKVFPEARIITLEENYRSTQPILNLTNQIIKSARERFEKRLFTRKEGRDFPLYIETRDEHEQSEFVAGKMLELREEGVELKDMAVLFRSGWHSNDLEIELARRDIPFVKYGGQRFVEAAHIKDMLAYFKIVYNPLDQVNWYRLLLLLPKIGAKTAQKIIEEVVLPAKAYEVNAADKLFQKSSHLLGLFNLLKKCRQTQDMPLAQMFQLFLEHYRPLLREKYDDFNKRGNDLDSLSRIICRYKSLERFLTDMALEPPERVLTERMSAQDKGDPTVTLSTIHSAKGLEWHTVFIIYMADGYLPSYLSLEDDEAIEEERRLFYVAATRARVNLFLIKPNVEIGRRSFFSEGASAFTQVSRFLEEGDILGKFLSTEAF